MVNEFLILLDRKHILAATIAMITVLGCNKSPSETKILPESSSNPVSVLGADMRPDGSSFALSESDKMMIKRILMKPGASNIPFNMNPEIEIAPSVIFQYSVDQFKENPGCTVWFKGTRLDNGERAVPKWDLDFYFTDSIIVSSNMFFDHGAKPIRLYVDGSAKYMEMAEMKTVPGIARRVLSNADLKDFSAAKKIKALHGYGVKDNEIGYTYDFTSFAASVRYATALCGPDHKKIQAEIFSKAEQVNPLDDVKPSDKTGNQVSVNAPPAAPFPALTDTVASQVPRYEPSTDPSLNSDAKVADTNNLQQVQTWMPSFDCQKASNGPERLICSSQALSQADVKLVQVYRVALSKATDTNGLRSAQTRWRLTIRDACADAGCILEAYRMRTAELESSE